MTVLIVDDSPLIIAKITELLEDVENVRDCKTCGSYDQAVQLLNDCNPQVVLLDINLPGRNGIELLKYIKDHSPQTVVLMVTNQVSDDYKLLCSHFGADYFIDKSKDFDRIPGILEAIASQR